MVLVLLIEFVYIFELRGGFIVFILLPDVLLFLVMLFVAKRAAERRGHEGQFAPGPWGLGSSQGNAPSTLQVKPAQIKPGYRIGPSDWSIQQSQSLDWLKFKLV